LTTRCVGATAIDYGTGIGRGKQGAGEAMAKFVSILTYGPNTEKRLAVRPKHREYLSKLLAEGKLHESGPFADDKGALIIYEAADETEARALIAADPYTDAGVVAENQLREWKRTMPA
jgi:uncharacterized protein YciI